MTGKIGLVGMLSGAVLAIASDTRAQSDAADPQSNARTERRVQFRFDDRPVVEVGRSIRFELGFRLDADVRTDAASEIKAGAFEWNGKRIEVAGRVTDRIAFELSHDLDVGSRWRDAFVDVRALNLLSVRTGQFKVPFSAERLRSLGRIDFVNRSLAADALAPGRAVGVMARGDLGRAVEYAIGVFDGRPREGVAADPVVADRHAGVLSAARVTVRPFARGDGTRQPRTAGVRATPTSPMRSLQLGVSVLRGSNVPSLSGLGARTFDSDELLFEPVYVNGPRIGVGTELQWSPGPLRVNAEWIAIQEDRRNQALDGSTLPALRARGWYASAIWRIARWRHDDDRWLARALLREVEIGARFEGIAFGTGDAPDTIVIHPRAEIIPWQDLHVLTLGTTWRLNRFSRIQLNAIHERPHARALVSVPDSRWSGVLKLQLQM
jgi:hypothetical protein